MVFFLESSVPQYIIDAMRGPNYYNIARKCVTPLLGIFHNYRILGADNLRKAAVNGKVVVCTTHSSDLGGMIVGLAVSLILNQDPYIVVNKKFQRNQLTNFFLKTMNIIWIVGNEMLGNYTALRQIRNILTYHESNVIIIAPQGVYNKPEPESINFRQGFAIPCIQAADVGIRINIVPAVDVGATYKSLPGIGKRIAAVFGRPILVRKRTTRQALTDEVERAVKALM